MTVYGSKFMFRATRNPVERIPAVCMKEKSKGGRPPKSAGEKLKERLTVKMAAADYYAPVSYTPLDVYKRQAQNSPRPGKDFAGRKDRSGRPIQSIHTR